MKCKLKNGAEFDFLGIYVVKKMLCDVHSVYDYCANKRNPIRSCRDMAYRTRPIGYLPYKNLYARVVGAKVGARCSRVFAGSRIGFSEHVAIIPWGY